MGRSMRPARPLDLPGLAAALISYCDAVGVERATFIGNSLGCPLIVEVASTFPDRIERAVLVSPAGGPNNIPVRRAVARWCSTPREPLSMVPIAVRDYLRFGVLQGWRLFQAMTRYPTLERVANLVMPTLVIAGDRDPLVRVERVGVFAGLPHVDAVPVSGAHALNYSAPELIAALIDAHIHGRPLVAPPGSTATVALLEVVRCRLPTAIRYLRPLRRPSAVEPRGACGRCAPSCRASRGADRRRPAERVTGPWPSRSTTPSSSPSGTRRSSWCAPSQQPCDEDGEPFVPMSVDRILDNPQVALRQLGSGDPTVMRGPGAADLADLGAGFYLDFPGDALDPGCLYEQDNDRFNAGQPSVVYAHIVHEDEHPDVSWRCSTGCTGTTTTGTTSTRATGSSSSCCSRPAASAEALADGADERRLRAARGR